MAINKIMPGHYDPYIQEFLGSDAETMALDQLDTSHRRKKDIRSSIAGRIIAMGLKDQVVCSLRNDTLYLAQSYECVDGISPAKKAGGARRQPSIHDELFQKFVDSGRPLGIIRENGYQDIHSVWCSMKYAAKSHGYPIHVAEDYANKLIYLIRTDAKEDSELYVDDY